MNHLKCIQIRRPLLIGVLEYPSVCSDYHTTICHCGAGRRAPDPKIVMILFFRRSELSNQQKTRIGVSARFNNTSVTNSVSVTEVHALPQRYQSPTRRALI